MRHVAAAILLSLGACSVKIEYADTYRTDGGMGDAGPDAALGGVDAAVSSCGTLRAACCPSGEGEAGCNAGLACVEDRCSCFADVATGNDHTCVLRTDGSLWCWGRNDFAQAGGSDRTMDQHSPAVVPGVSEAVAIVAGGQHSCSLSAAGQVSCFGNNEAGQLGIPASEAESTPVNVAGLPAAVELALGSRHSCALSADGKVWCWGCQIYNDWTGCATFSPPAEIPGLDQVTQLWAHHKHTCAKQMDGTTLCWGRNDFGQLGDGTRIDKPEPTVVTLVPGITGMAGGRYHACALREDGQVWCWANNEDGQLGRGTVTEYEDTAQAVPSLPAAKQVVGGGWFSCALSTAGEAFCWGDASDGQLGYGGIVGQTAPVKVLGLVDVLRLESGSFHICAQEPDAILCWGANGSGSVGNGTTTDLPIPIRVMTCEP